MSSVTSTKRAAAPTHFAPGSPGLPGTGDASRDADQGLRPWQFFVLAGLACATAITWMARAQGFISVLLLTVIMGTIALAALAALRTIQPLVSAEEDRTQMVGERTRVALEREKMLTLRAIKELEFDRAMKKLSEEDFNEMGGRLRARASRLIRQLDAAGGYRDRIEKDLQKRLGDQADAGAATAARGAAPSVCAACSTANDHDARFCKSCGARL